MAAIEVDESRWPLMVVRFHGIATDAEFKSYIADMTRLLARGKRAAILDATDAGATPAHHRKMQAEWLREHREFLDRNSLGTAFVINSAIVRGILTAIFWVQPMPGPTTVVAEFADAERWAVTALRNAGMPVPAAPIAQSGKR